MILSKIFELILGIVHFPSTLITINHKSFVVFKYSHTFDGSLNGKCIYNYYWELTGQIRQTEISVSTEISSSSF